MQHIPALTDDLARKAYRRGISAQTKGMKKKEKKTKGKAQSAREKVAGKKTGASSMRLQDKENLIMSLKDEADGFFNDAP